MNTKNVKMDLTKYSGNVLIVVEVMFTSRVWIVFKETTSYLDNHYIVMRSTTKGLQRKNTEKLHFIIKKRNFTCITQPINGISVVLFVLRITISYRLPSSL